MLVQALALNHYRKTSRRILRAAKDPVRASGDYLVLGSLLCDVELPPAPLRIPEELVVPIRRAAAGELVELFAGARRAAFASSFDLYARADLFDRVAPLWRELASASWDVVSIQEDSRVEAAVVAALDAAEVASRTGLVPDGVGVVEFWAQVWPAICEDPSHPLAESIRVALASHGIGMRHLSSAVSRILA